MGFLKSIFRTSYPSDRQSSIRTVSDNFFFHIHPTLITDNALKFSRTWCMGGLTFMFFLILCATGALLALYYRPTPDHAYEDMRDIIFTVPLGRILRNMHRWSANGMIICMYFHLLRVFLTGSYKPPRQFNWVVGVVLLVLVHFISFTGYLLTWDQGGYWAFTVSTEMAKSAPIVGSDGHVSQAVGVNQTNDARHLLLGGTELNQPASLLRSYTLHCFILPLFLVILMGVHFWRVRKDNKLSKTL